MDIPQMRGEMPLSLADLLTPLAPEEFFSTIYRKKPAYIPGVADKFAFAMSWDILNGLLNQSLIWTPQTLQLVLDTSVVPAAQYAREAIGIDGRPVVQVDFAKVRGLVGRGASIVLNTIETFSPGIKRIFETLSNEPGGKVQANLYCSWQRHQAFDVHFDTHDVFAMQIEGEKMWRVYQRHIALPLDF